MIRAVERNGKNFGKIDLKRVEAIYAKAKTTDPVTDKLISELKGLDPEGKNKKVGQLRSSAFQAYEMDTNPEMLMEKAMKIPRNSDDAQFTK